eukprot:1143672-Pelagomonas_calceolata.AAC.2
METRQARMLLVCLAKLISGVDVRMPGVWSILGAVKAPTDSSITTCPCHLTPVIQHCNIHPPLPVKFLPWGRPGGNLAPSQWTPPNHAPSNLPYPPIAAGRLSRGAAS